MKPRAFMPRDGETSVFRTAGLELSEILDIGVQEVAAPRGRTLYGLGQLDSRDVRETRLDIQANEPPPRHANIVGWPGDPAEQLSLAQELSRRARLALSPA